MSENPICRRAFVEKLSIGSVGALMAGGLAGQAVAADPNPREKKREPVSDRKVRMGIVGYGVCRFGAAFGFQDHLAHEFITAILENRRPLVDVYEALAMTVPGIVAHQSALKGGAALKIPQYERPAQTAGCGRGQDDSGPICSLPGDAIQVD